MSRFSRYDSDEDRLPEGMRRIGYDADTQVYSFQDSDGSYWEGAPGCEYGQLTRVGGDAALDEAADAEPFLVHDGTVRHTSWRAELMPLLNFGVIIGASLLGLFWYLHYAAGGHGQLQPTCSPDQSTYVIHQGDTCWAIVEGRGSSVDDILRANEGLDCDRLRIGSIICLPE
ncbi:hypothetical protein C2857_002448 [Epichloe festucae Fl1]|uniref:LysM domain-containing protein n=1 Tax=Epichloe festucae (strain Fl1) TaxID=877507 RepID=A0A7U3SMK6_EPIFF|nr:hypothetical protein C2857_002448 [Epichloe festucae Fl1]